MALTPDALEYRETPVVNTNFLVIDVPDDPMADLLDTVNGIVAAVGAASIPPYEYPPMPIGLLISANISEVLISSQNPPGTAVAMGINIPIGQSLYLPIAVNSLSIASYSCPDSFSVGVFFAEG
jgi:hypothetical protein